MSATSHHHGTKADPNHHGDNGSEHRASGGEHQHESMSMSDHVAMFRRLFWGNLVLAVPVVATAPDFAHLLGYSLPDSPIIRAIPPVLGTVMYVWGGRPFLTGARSEIKARKPAMMLLVSLGITVAFFSSWGATLGLLPASLSFWSEFALLVVIMLLGHWVEMRSLARTSSALDSLAELLPDQAERVVGDTTEMVSPDQLRVGDRVLVRPGGSVPADGTVVEGSANFNESMVTGESKAVLRSVGDHVVGGTVATDSNVTVQVSAIGDDTVLAGIQRLVAQAQAGSTPTQRLADRAAGWLFWFALGAAAITIVVWLSVGTPAQALTRAITVLVIACPHALGLAIPLVVSTATGMAAKAGILISSRSALEDMRRIDVALMDKTGTLTRGKPALVDAIAVDGVSRDDVLALAAAAESKSEHPLAHAITQAAKHEDIKAPPAKDVSSEPALGVSATVKGKTIRVGGPRLLDDVGADPLKDSAAWSAAGSTVLHVVRDSRVIGALRIEDELRPESPDAVKAIQALGARAVMITGDARDVAESVGKTLGVDRVIAQVRPEDKADEVEKIKRDGDRVAMTGDGVNDAPALTAATVGLAIGGGTDVAIASADVVLANSDPRAVVSMIELSRASYAKMQQNLVWAAGYNLISVPLAAGVLAPIGFVMPMSVGALLMSASTVIVAFNAQLLRRRDIAPGAAVATALGRRG